MTLIRYLILACLLAYSSVACSLQVNNLSCLENLNPGEKKQIKISLFNDSDVREQVSLKLADYSCNSMGEHFYDEERTSAHVRSNRAWIDFGEEYVHLEPRETRNIYYTIQVPNRDDLKGSYWSILLIEPNGIPNFKQSEDGFSLQIKIRYAHHIVVTVGNGAPKLKIIKKEIKEIDNKRLLCLHVLNDGDLFFDPELTLKLYDKQGRLEHTLESQAERLYPGNSQCFFLNCSNIEESYLTKNLSGFLLFQGKNNVLFGDKFVYP